MAEDKPIGYRVDGSPIYDNTPTVVCVLTAVGPQRNHLLVIRRKSGLFGLPGGFQMGRERWQEAGARETYEETGYVVDPSALIQFDDVVTDEYGHNMIFALSVLVAQRDPEAVLDGEALEVQIINPAEAGPDDWEFPLHYRASVNWLHR